MAKRKMRERARYLILRGTYGDKTLRIVLRVIFWHEPEEGVWCGRCIEAENIFTVADEPEKLEWMMADAVASMVEFASEHGFLESLFKEPSRKDLKRWNALREKENLPLDLPDIRKLEFHDLYPAKKPRRGWRPIQQLSHQPSFYTHA